MWLEKCEDDTERMLKKGEMAFCLECFLQSYLGHGRTSCVTVLGATSRGKLGWLLSKQLYGNVSGERQRDTVSPRDILASVKESISGGMCV